MTEYTKVLSNNSQTFQGNELSDLFFGKPQQMGVNRTATLKYFGETTCSQFTVTVLLGILSIF